MEKKRALLVNGLTLLVVLLLIAGVWIASTVVERRVVPDGGTLEMEFVPAGALSAPTERKNTLEDLI
ncbi:MAG: hypothetical protein E7327_07615 [Clostridiales bacterium]|nr:hypothetical protein [Clostridiales bacterium]